MRLLIATLTTAAALKPPGTGLFSDMRGVECTSTQESYIGAQCCTDGQTIDVFGATADEGLMQPRLQQILDRGYLIAAVWNRDFHCELDGDVYASSTRKTAFPDIDNNPVPTYTYILEHGSPGSFSADERKDDTIRTQEWKFNKIMLDETVKQVPVSLPNKTRYLTDGTPQPYVVVNGTRIYSRKDEYSHTIVGTVSSTQPMNKYTHRLADKTLVHHKAVYCHPDSLYPAMIAKALGVGLQLVPMFAFEGNPYWFATTHLLAQGLVDMVGNTITPKVARNFAWQGMPLPAYMFTADQLVMKKSVLEACNPTLFHSGASYADTNDNLEAAVACTDGQPIVLAVEGTTCYEAFGEQCAKAGISKNPVGTKTLDYCEPGIYNQVVGISTSAYQMASVRAACPSYFDNTVAFTLKRDLLSVLAYPDAHLFMYSKAVLDMMKNAIVNNKGLSDPDIGLPSTSANTELAKYGDKSLVLHGNDVLSTYGNLREAHELLGRNFETDLPIVYEEFFF